MARASKQVAKKSPVRKKPARAKGHRPRKSPTIAVAQPRLLYDTERNVEKITGFIAKAKGRGADLVCFPEVTLQVDTLDVSAGPIRRIRDACKEHGIYAIVGDYLRMGKQVYNAVLLINREGKIAGVHKKVFLCEWRNDITAGRNFAVFDTDLGKIGICICWDVAFPVPIHAMAKRGADIIFCPMFWNFDWWAHRKNHFAREKRILQAIALTRAYENVCYFALCNPVVKKDEDVVPYSAIAEPHRILKEIYGKEGLLVQKLDYRYLDKVRRKFGQEYDKFLAGKSFSGK